MEAERTLACAMAGSMRAGATPGALFDMLREFATEPPGQSGALREMFVQHAVFLLLRHSRDGILAWLDGKAEPPLLSLQRALR
ncbi:MAG: hypothetical protein JNK48_34725 [Bryobacterales bacterium]|nr:hypothetical protein [Bryobacterales bacterium]